MTPAPASAAVLHRSGSWLAKTEAWLDARGRGAWIAAMVLGFIAFWPVGLVLVAYMTWAGKWSLDRRTASVAPRRFGGTGNAAFDAYKADMLRRLEDEQAAFEEFLQRLREARDKAEFDQFMDERAKRTDDGGHADEKDAA